MTNPLHRGLLALLMTMSPSVAPADGTPPLVFTLHAAVAQARYGLLIASPAAVDCGSVRFVVRDGDGVVGQSRGLRPGEAQVVRIGSYTAGNHALTIVTSGCAVAPAAIRRVRLGKSSPDHGWQAAAFVQASFTP